VFAFVNLTATAEAVRRAGTPLVLVAAGRRGGEAVEDTLAVGALIAELARLGKVELDDTGRECHRLWAGNADRLAEVLWDRDSGRNLRRLGYEADIEMCARRDASRRVVMVEEADGLVWAAGE
jgi:2-phosphosulfolactate phosphatase